jgi:urease beta subunit
LRRQVQEIAGSPVDVPVSGEIIRERLWMAERELRRTVREIVGVSPPARTSQLTADEVNEFLAYQRESANGSNVDVPEPPILRAVIRQADRELRRQAEEIVGVPPAGRTFRLNAVQINDILAYQRESANHSAVDVPVPAILREIRANEALYQGTGSLQIPVDQDPQTPLDQDPQADNDSQAINDLIPAEFQ